jgi:alpha-glucosidase
VSPDPLAPGPDDRPEDSPDDPSDDRLADPNWWRQAVVYQIYPRSFADSNADGVGDLPGVTSRVPYLASLGVDAVWLSPFYPSALADGGYDVDDYRAVDPRLGTLDDFDEMARALHAAGIRLIVDIVPNHSSNRHVWFQEALASPKGSPARERYIFRDGTGPDGARPPSDWESRFGGPAWTRVPDGQWYLHLFAPEQPDLNWENPEVREDFRRTLRFWSDRGADGFRVDVAHALAKDMSEPLPAAAAIDDGAVPHGKHPVWDRDEVHEIYVEWRQVFDEYDPPRAAVAEAWVHPTRRARYASASGLGQAFNFDLLRANWDPAQYRRIISSNLAEAGRAGTSSTWVFSNHDVVRHATRYGLPPAGGENGQDGKAWLRSGGRTPKLDVERGSRRARAASLLMLALPGSGYLYQGEELGLHEVGDLPPEVLQDPTFRRSRGEDKGRDGCRVPLPWTKEGASFGFGDDGAHLPQPPWFGSYAVAAQEGEPSSTLELYRAALGLRRKLQTEEALEWVESGDEVLHFVRPGGWHCVTNFGSRPVALPAGTVAVSSGPLDGGMLPPDTTAWVV